LTGTLSESCSGRAALRRKQQEQFESKHGGKTEPQKGSGTPIGYSEGADLRRETCGIFTQSKNFGGRETGVAV
jgi:hypothetical protein